MFQSELMKSSWGSGWVVVWTISVPQPTVTQRSVRSPKSGTGGKGESLVAGSVSLGAGKARGRDREYVQRPGPVNR